jgi:hypothetical protein
MLLNIPQVSLPVYADFSAFFVIRESEVG